MEINKSNKFDRDEQLANHVARCALQDEAALKAIFDAVGGFLHHVIWKIVQDKDAAADVLQEAMVQIWQNANQYRPHKAKALTWMASIARYRALDRLAADKKRNTYIQIDTDFVDDIELSEASQQSSPDLDIQRQQAALALDKCFAQLKDNMRKCLQWAYIHGMSREELADKFDTNTNTIKSWLHRGAQKLKVCLQGQEHALD